jgi:hypothetical protein
VWMVGSAASLLQLHFYTGVVVHRRHGWEIGAPSSFSFLLPTFSRLSFGWFCGGQESREAELARRGRLWLRREGWYGEGVLALGDDNGEGGSAVALLMNGEGNWVKARW